MGTSALSAGPEYRHLEQKESKTGAHTALGSVHSSVRPGRGLVPSEGFTLLILHHSSQGMLGWRKGECMFLKV